MSLCRLPLLLALVATAANGALAKLGPSNCRARDADSTCAAAVAAATVLSPILPDPRTTLYDGPLGGVPANGYAYWGYDFIADQAGTPSPVRQDEYINRSRVPVTITLSFDFPADHACGSDCLADVQFEMGPGWGQFNPPYVKAGHAFSASATVKPGDGYAWVIGLWQSTHPRLTVTIPAGASATIAEVGLVPAMARADEIPAVVGTCQCDDATLAGCSDGSHFSNGKLGLWSHGNDGYVRDGAFNACVQH